MRIPKIISKNNREYIYEKTYPNYIMYKDLLTGVKECFSRYELGLLKEQMPRTRNLQKIHKR